MRVTFELFPSPLMGEGAGGGEDNNLSPHPPLPPPRGKGYLPISISGRKKYFPAPVSRQRGGYGRVMIVL
jgi:hypothetical protein